MASWSANGADLINKFAANLQFDAVIAFEDELIRLTGGVIVETPIGLFNGGVAKNNWQIARKPNDRVLKGANKRKGGNFAQKKIRGKMGEVSRTGIRKISNKSMFFFNNSPYIKVLEFGGYPSPVKKGTWNRRTRKFEIRSQGGFSKQAPKGMFRLNIIRYKNRMRKRIASL